MLGHAGVTIWLYRGNYLTYLQGVLLPGAVEALHHLPIDAQPQHVRADLVHVRYRVRVHVHAPPRGPYERHQHVVDIFQALRGVLHGQAASVTSSFWLLFGKERSEEVFGLGFATLPSRFLRFHPTSKRWISFSGCAGLTGWQAPPCRAEPVPGFWVARCWYQPVGSYPPAAVQTESPASDVCAALLYNEYNEKAWRNHSEAERMTSIGTKSAELGMSINRVDLSDRPTVDLSGGLWQTELVDKGGSGRPRGQVVVVVGPHIYSGATHGNPATWQRPHPKKTHKCQKQLPK